ncbi:HEAT repeat domain-containing protein [Anaeromyxobacter oryzae]|uniref:PBS lyase HEAT domain protein repeat-containing protein n=1 Tax=Anaeromyxobacter oryzae TaxID=2918170 RepID=A0ABN6MSQ1_9BACT|nr:HEAT repeat domain-containing protein [Anaeromyxobacter oryzae]BDG02778.1 hypothetical protein AMOR_17740 [Anaeromyxobacter oryzae]
MADGTEVTGAVSIDPEGYLRSALEKIVFFECRVSQLESELQAARTVAERGRGDAAQSRRREVELEQLAAAERGARADAEARASDLAERVRLLEGERERLLGGLVDRARVAGAPGSDGTPGPEEGGADLAGFIAELRAEIETLRAWKAAAEAQGLRVDGAAAYSHAPRAAAEPVARLAGRFEAEGRVGVSGRDTDRMKDLLATRADRVLYERSMDDLRAPDAGARLRAVRALEALGSKAAAPLLAVALGREPEGEVKGAILLALGRFKEPFAAELAARELGDPRPAVRVAALDALAAVAEGAAEERLAGALSDASPLVRRRAALLLGFAPGERAEAALAGALADPDRGVARAAAAALSGRPTARAQGALARALEHPDASVRRAAAGSLSRVAGERVDVEGSASARRAVSRRIAAKLAAMDGAALREAVIVGAGAARADATRRASATATPNVVKAAVSVHPNAPLTPALSPRKSAGGEGGPLVASAKGSAGAATVAAAPVAAASAVGARVAAASAVAAPVAAASAVAAPVARATVAVLVQQAAVAGGPADDLEATVVSEVRAALRGCTPEGLAATVGAPAARIEAALAALESKGTVAKRGTRWFMA